MRIDPPAANVPPVCNEPVSAPVVNVTLPKSPVTDPPGKLRISDNSDPLRVSVVRPLTVEAVSVPPLLL